MLIFNLFITTVAKQIKSSVFSKFFLDFKLAFLLLNRWEKHYSNNKVNNKVVIDFSRHFPHEFFPFFEYSRQRPEYKVSRFSRLLTFKARNSGLFHGGISNLSLNAINMLYRDFKKALPYKSMTFSKKFQRYYVDLYVFELILEYYLLITKDKKRYDIFPKVTFDFFFRKYPPS